MAKKQQVDAEAEALAEARAKTAADIRRLAQVGRDLAETLIANSVHEAGTASFLRDYLTDLTSEEGTVGRQRTAMRSFEEETKFALDEMNLVAEAHVENSRKVQQMEGMFNSFQDELNEFNRNRENMNEIIVTITQALKKIAAQIHSIQDISAQTHLLSINASIEAARAGELGQGFRIIANEVKRLSETTDANTKAVEDNIESFAEKLDTLVNANDAGKEVVNKLSQTASETQAVLNEIGEQSEDTANTVKQTVDKIAEINNRMVTVAREVEGDNVGKVKDLSNQAAKSIFDLNDKVSLLIEVKNVFASMLAK